MLYSGQPMREREPRVESGRSIFDFCRVCDAPLDQPATGRKKKFCGGACKQKNYREMKKWVTQAVDAALAGEPEPAKWWLSERWQNAQFVTKRRRSDPDRGLADEVS